MTRFLNTLTQEIRLGLVRLRLRWNLITAMLYIVSFSGVRLTRVKQSFLNSSLIF